MNYKSLKNGFRKVGLTAILAGALVSTGFSQNSQKKDKQVNNVDTLFNGVVDGDSVIYTSTKHKTLFGSHEDRLLTVKTPEGIEMVLTDYRGDTKIDKATVQLYENGKVYDWPSSIYNGLSSINSHTLQAISDEKLTNIAYQHPNVGYPFK